MSETVWEASEPETLRKPPKILDTAGVWDTKAHRRDEGEGVKKEDRRVSDDHFKTSF